MPKVSAEHKNEVRQRFLSAAWQVIERDGPEGATTRAILEEAGMSTGALYSYFPSKVDLFAALAEWQVEERRSLGGTADTSALEERLVGAEEAVSSLFRFVVEMFTEPDESPAFIWFRSRTDVDSRPALKKVNQAMVDQFASQVAAAQKANVMDPGYDTEALVELFDILVVGMGQRYFTGTLATSYERIGQVASTILLKGVLQDGRTGPDSTGTGGTGDRGQKGGD